MSGTSASSLAQVGAGSYIGNGTLKLLKVLGSGGFGTVYLARDTQCGSIKDYAVKALRQTKDTHKKGLQLRELELHARVNTHPNIVSFHRSFSDEQNLYFVFDACLGGDLFSVIAEKGTYFYEDDLARDAFVQILDAVKFCHDNGVYHRDLKPENILCSADGKHLYLTDFGLATVNTESSSFRMGSTPYMSPECIGEDWKLGTYSTITNDVWALGMILINLLTGRIPWGRAALSDDNFRYYLKRGKSFFQAMLPLSTAASELLCSILALNPMYRLTLNEMHVRVLGVKTFFMNKEELEIVLPAVSSAFQSYMDLKINAAGKPVSVSSEESSSGDMLFPPAPLIGGSSTSGSSNYLLTTPKTHAVAEADIADDLDAIEDLALPTTRIACHLAKTAVRDVEHRKHRSQTTQLHDVIQTLRIS